MLPDKGVGLGDAFGVGATTTPVRDDEHAASSTTATRTRARLMETSNVGPGLPPVHRDACAVQEAGLPRAYESDDVGDLLDRSESPQRHLGADEVGDAFRVRLLPPRPTAAIPQDRAWRHAVDGHALRGHLARLRGRGTELRRQCDVVCFVAVGIAILM